LHQVAQKVRECRVARRGRHPPRLPREGRCKRLPGATEGRYVGEKKGTHILFGLLYLTSGEEKNKKEKQGRDLEHSGKELVRKGRRVGRVLAWVPCHLLPEKSKGKRKTGSTHLEKSGGKKLRGGGGRNPGHVLLPSREDARRKAEGGIGGKGLTETTT